MNAIAINLSPVEREPHCPTPELRKGKICRGYVEAPAEMRRQMGELPGAKLTSLPAGSKLSTRPYGALTSMNQYCA